MPQDTSYPDPKQLRAFADDPMPFTNVEGLTLHDDGRLTGASGGVEYEYTTEYIRISPRVGDHYRASEYPEWGFSHSEAWENRGHSAVESDYIEATGFVDGMESSLAFYEAYWGLDSITINVPE
jgi:hypothetical protein